MNVPWFGDRVEGVTYTPRPGAYAVVVNQGRIACVRVGRAFHLPGGGVDPGESMVDALAREVLEETGHEVHIEGVLGHADEYLVLGNGPTVKIGTFYRCRFGEYIADPVETDHVLVWVPRDDALERLHHGSQRYVVGLL